jgi:hypothetical protein
MEPRDDEEKALRSVALQNAQSILLARQRAEEELVRAKEAMELKTHELARSLAMMRATLESSTDGILVTDGGGKVTGRSSWRCGGCPARSWTRRKTDNCRKSLANTSTILGSSLRGLRTFTRLRRQKAMTFWSSLIEEWSSDPQGFSSSMSGTWAASGAFETSRPGSRPSGPPASSPTPVPLWPN